MFLPASELFFYQPRRDYPVKETCRPLGVNVKAAFLGL